MLFPETEKTINKERIETSGDVGNNLLDAISRGTTDGIKLAVNVGAMLLVFTALVFTINKAIMNGPGEWFHLNELVVDSTNGRFEGFTFTYILGLIFAPIAWLLGTPGDDILVMGQLLGQKTVINEFVAYAELQKIQAGTAALSKKSLIIATYALCGFANFASIGIQIGGIGAIAPKQRKLLTELGLKALIGGTIASFLTAALVGMFY
jgi:CNT family concentrative nucleoside transporter